MNGNRTARDWLNRVIAANRKRRRDSQIPFVHLMKMAEQDDKQILTTGVN